jgi:hypothetical protein
MAVPLNQFYPEPDTPGGAGFRLADRMGNPLSVEYAIAS